MLIRYAACDIPSTKFFDRPRQLIRIDAAGVRDSGGCDKIGPMDSEEMGTRHHGPAAHGVAVAPGGASRRARRRRLASLALVLVAAAGCAGGTADRGAADGDEIILATTSSTYDTGLLDRLIERFEAGGGRRVKMIVVGSGKALALAGRGEADIVLVHAPGAERRFMNDGGGRRRRRMMYNDFILVGPDGDQAPVAGAGGILPAMRAIVDSGSIFVSRGDESGTHQFEKGLWDRLSIRPQLGRTYLETGQGMAATLRIASEKGACTLTDRGTYLAQREGLALAILSEGDPLLRNVYHLIVVDPTRGPRVNLAGAEALARFLLSKETLAMVGEFGRERYGRPLFVPDPEPYGSE